jgi:hypothetical protein
MIRSEAKSFLLKEFLSNFDTTVPISLSNRGFYLSDGTVSEKPVDEPWVKFWIQNNDANQHSFGAAPNRSWKRMGFIAAQVFIPEGTATYDGDILCEEIIDIFEGKRFSQIVCYAGTYREAGNIEEGYFTYDVTIYYDFYERK